MGMDGSAVPMDKQDQQRLPDIQQQQAQTVEGYLKWQSAADNFASRDPNSTSDTPEGQQLVLELRELIGGQEKAAMFVAPRIMRRCWDVSGKAHATMTADALRVCVAAAGPVGSKAILQELTNMWVNMQSEVKWNRDIAEALLRRELLVLPEVDAFMAKSLLLRNTTAIDFAVLLAKAVKDGVCGAASFSNTLDLLAKVTAGLTGSEQVLQLLNAARAASKVRAAERAGLPDVAGLRDKADPPGLHQQVAALFEDFARRCMATPEEKVHAPFVQQLRQAGLLALDDNTDRMLRTLVELAVQHCLQSETATPRQDGTFGPGPLSFLAVDPLVKLVVCLTSAHGGGEKFLSRFLTVTAALIRRDAEDRVGEFNARPYLRLLVGLTTELGGGEGGQGASAAAQDVNSLRLLRLIGLTLLTLQPSSVPGFGFAYLELLSHRSFMPRLLMAPQQGGWPLFEALLVGLLQFLEPALRAADLGEPLRLLYKGTLRLLLVLLHDFPEFLCEHHFHLCDVIPAPAIQMRNLILSAFPRNMRLPDPFTPNLKVDLLPEISSPPRGAPASDALLPPALRSAVDALLNRRPPGGIPPNAISQLVSRLTLTPEQQAGQQQQPGRRTVSSNFNVPLINALVLYVGSCSAPGAAVLPTSPGIELLSRLASELDAEGRYLLLNGIANQLRYPNSHTHYFSCVLLSLFAEAPPGPVGEAVQAQVTRVLLERLIVNRPHPWGLLITFIELIKNPRFNFWSYSFTRCAPEIERLFESVARSCMGPASLPPQAAAAKAAADVEELKA
jgi:CCR4-NOT transcription complex subunit 1